MQLKSYTDINQSSKLSEILSLESADMCLTFVNNMWNPVWDKADDIYQLHKDNYEPDYTKDEYIDFDEYEPKVVPCWSLASLLNILERVALFKTPQGWVCQTYIVSKTETTNYYDNPIDACYEMIIHLHELKML